MCKFGQEHLSFYTQLIIEALVLTKESKKVAARTGLGEV